jgi:hypothetical protein
MKSIIIALTFFLQMQLDKPERGNVKQDFAKLAIKGNREVQLKLKEIYLEQEPDFLGESKMRLRFVLKNIGKCLIYVDTLGSKEDRILLDDVFGGVACLQAFNIDNPNNLPCCNLSMGYSNFDFSTITDIKPGKTLKFSLPVDHLSGGRCVRIRYWTEKSSPPISEDEYKYIWVSVGVIFSAK